LTEDERERLVRWSWRAESPQAVAQRCEIVLGCADGKLNQQVAAELGIWPQTVGKWWRFAERRLERLVDEPRPGAPRKITDERADGGGDAGAGPC
jgi:transposase